MNDEGTITVERITRPDGGYRTRITRADQRVRISLDLLELIEAGDIDAISVDGEWLSLSDDYAFQACYRLGDLDDTGRARWMEKL